MRPRTIGMAVTVFVISLFSTVHTALAQDVISAAATSRSGTANGVMVIPVFVKDLTGTPAGRDQVAASQISAIEFKIDFDAAKIAGCLVAQGNCDFVEGGILSGVKPGAADVDGNVCDKTAATGCNFRAITRGASSLTYTISTNPPAALTTSADPVGDLIGYVKVVLASNFCCTMTSTMDVNCSTATDPRCAGYLGGTDGASAETLANSSLTVTGTAAQKAILDLDANGAVDAFTDGILAIRRMSPLTQSGTSLTLSGQAVSPTAARPNAADLARYIDSLGRLADVDGDGKVDAFTDGILIIRYMAPLNQTGTSLTLSGQAVSPTCTRCTAAAIQAYLAQMIQN